MEVSDEEMRNYLMERNIGFNFKTNKSKIPRLNKKKLKQCYDTCINVNNLGDISKLQYDNIPDFDLFNFSFPCTDISIAGKQKGMKDEEGNTTRSGLYVYGIEVIKAKQPKYIMIENVKNLISKKFIHNFNDMINEIESLGYNCYYPTKDDNYTPTCLNAKNYGIPQNRERIFVICVRKDVDNNGFVFPKGFDNGLRLKDILEEEVDEKYYLNKVKNIKVCDSYIQFSNSGKMQNSQAERLYFTNKNCPVLPYHNNGDKSQIIDCNKEEFIEIIHTDKTKNLVNQLIKNNQIQGDITPSDSTIMKPKALDIANCITARYDAGIQNKQSIGVVIVENVNNRTSNELLQTGELKGGKRDNVIESCKRVYDSNNISPTINTYGGGNTEAKIYNYNIDNMVNSFTVRKLTPKECWRLMGFRDECIDRAIRAGISNSQLYKQAGNSIVVNVEYYIFKELFKQYILK